MTDKLMPTAALDASLEPSRVGRRTTTIRRLVLLAFGLIAAFGLPWFVYPPVAMDIAAWALFAISVDLLLGYTGLLSFGHAAFWGSSAYVTGLIALNFGVPFPVAIIGGTITSTLLTLVVVPAAYSLLENWRERRRAAPGRHAQSVRSA